MMMMGVAGSGLKYLLGGHKMSRKFVQITRNTTRVATLRFDIPAGRSRSL